MVLKHTVIRLLLCQEKSRCAAAAADAKANVGAGAALMSLANPLDA